MKRVGNSFKGIVGGFVAILIGVVLLWWNEGNNVKNIKTTAEMSKNYIDVTSETIDPNNEGKLIATNGKLLNEEELYDPTFDVKVKAPVLLRIVEMYQWKEESESDEDGDTRYTYKKEWVDTLVDSNNFHNGGHNNPSTMPYNSQKLFSSRVNVGAFLLTNEQLNMLSTEGIFNDFNTEKMTELKYVVNGNYITNSKDINNPEVGDIRISFVYNNSTDVSVLAVQSGNSFKDYVSSVGKTVNRVMDGIKSGDEMIKVIEKENKILKWILRLVGAMMIVGGIATILKPISAVTSYIPLLGSVVGAAVFLISLVLGLALSFVVIAIAWIRFRPILGISLLVSALALVIFVIIRGKNKKEVPVQNTNQNIESNN